MKIIKEYARHHPDVFDYFSRSRLDAFLDEDVLSVIHGDNWCSVLLAERGNALLHVFAKKPIGETGWYDIEPFIGYAGPVSTTADPSFLAAALESYRDICLGERIVAEVIRFSPILENHSVFADSAIDVVVAKPIIVVACENEESEMMARYSGFCRNRIRRGSKEVTFHEMDRTREMETFAAFLSESLDRVGAESAWRFSPAFFERARDSEKFSLYRVARGDEMLCACMVIFHPRSAYYFLVATSPRRVHGANEILVHGIAPRGSRARHPALDPRRWELGRGGRSVVAVQEQIFARAGPVPHRQAGPRTRRVCYAARRSRTSEPEHCRIEVLPQVPFGTLPLTRRPALDRAPTSAQSARNSRMLSHTLATSASLTEKADGSHTALGIISVATGNCLSGRR